MAAILIATERVVLLLGYADAMRWPPALYPYQIDHRSSR